jgi:predicted CopG family antitoxin
MQQEDTKTVRISIDAYKKLIELGRKDQTFADILDNIFVKNKLIGVVTTEDQ